MKIASHRSDSERDGSWLVFSAIPLALLLLIVAIGCSGRPAYTHANADAASVNASTAGQGTLVLYSGRKESLIGPLIQDFENATGIDVRVKYGKTAALAATLMEEGDNSPADVYYAQDPGGLGAVAHLMREVPDSVIQDLPEWAIDRDRKWVGVSGRARTIVYNPAQLAEDELPNSLQDLSDPKWAGRIGWAPTNSSLITMITGMRALWGEAETRQWLKGFLANDPVQYPKNTPQVAAVGAGEIELGLVNHYYLHRFTAEDSGFPAKNLYLSNGGPGSLVMVSGVSVLSTAPNIDNAMAFLSYLVSDEAQTYFVEKTYEYPLKEGVTPHAGLPSLESLDIPEISLSSLADLDGTLSLMRELGAIP